MDTEEGRLIIEAFGTVDPERRRDLARRARYLLAEFAEEESHRRGHGTEVMNEEHPLSLLYTVAMEGVCGETVNGWLWYCDVHDTHGNADSEEEAQLLAQTHSDFFHDDDDEEEPCDIVVWMRTEHERRG